MTMRIYTDVSGSERYREDPKRCIAVVNKWRQCSRRRRYGPHGQFCKQHAEAYGWDTQRNQPRGRCDAVVNGAGYRNRRRCNHSNGHGRDGRFCRVHT